MELRFSRHDRPRCVAFAKAAETESKGLSKIIQKSNRDASLIETDDGKELNESFLDFLSGKNVKRYSRYISKRAIFAKTNNRQVLWSI